LKSTETSALLGDAIHAHHFSNFDSLKSTETDVRRANAVRFGEFQQFRLVEEY